MRPMTNSLPHVNRANSYLKILNINKFYLRSTALAFRTASSLVKYRCESILDKLTAQMDWHVTEFKPPNAWRITPTEWGRKVEPWAQAPIHWRLLIKAQFSNFSRFYSKLEGIVALLLASLRLITLQCCAEKDMDLSGNFFLGAYAVMW
jgi:hypothetical protein